MRDLPEEHMDAINVATIQANWMANFTSNILKSQEIVRHLRRSRHFTSALQAKYKQVQHESIVLRDERGELQTTNDSVAVCVVHVLVVDNNVVLSRHVIGNVVINDQTQQSIEKSQINLLVELLEL